jgi:ubiquinone/menaquinone biosynthesis C-methylase UbiE
MAMQDVYARIAEVPSDVQERLADIIELRAQDPRYQAMVRAYLSAVQFPAAAKVLEIGCGTGSITRTLAGWPDVAQATGVDPSPVFIHRARSLSAGIGNIDYIEGDGRCLGLPAGAFDVVVVNTTLSHVPEPERLLAEGFRVLGALGSLAVFDGDYATATVALGPLDPLQPCIEAFRTHFVNDAWLLRRLPQLIATAGFELLSMQSHGYVEAPEGAYMLSWIDRGSDVLVQEGQLSQETADALKAEARHRSARKRWYGHIAFASIIARKPS